jgi:alpha-mannosidase
LSLASGLPRFAQPHEHEEPSGEHLYALPDNPPLMLAEDWLDRARAAGAIVFTATPKRDETLQNLFEALRAACPDEDRLARLCNLSLEQVAPFFGIGYGCVVLEVLFEAMSHDNVLASKELFQDLVTAVDRLEVGEAEAAREHLQSAADRLLSAREVVYPVSLYVVDLFLVDPEHPGQGWPGTLQTALPTNFIASGSLIDRLAREHPDLFALLREKVDGDLAEVLGGPYVELEDPLLPIETQLWNLRKGQQAYLEQLGREVRIFARRRSAFHAQLPLFLQSVGISLALLVSFDEAQIPSHQTIVINWPSHDGKQVDSFTRTPLPADSPQTYFHLAHHLHQTIMQDQAATLPLVHKGQPAPVWHQDWLELTRFAPVLGRWVTLSSYFNEVMSGDYTVAVSPDEFHTDYLCQRTSSEAKDRARAISGFAEQVRSRRRIDAAWTFATILRSLGGALPDVDSLPFLEHLARVEDLFETATTITSEEIANIQNQTAEALARRLVARGQANSAGWLLLNPCSFTRRAALELSGLTRAVAAGGPVKACQIDGELARLVVEIPPLGFSWVPRDPPQGPALTTRIRLADERAVRNEFFEAEIDPQTGGLKTIRDTRQRLSRLGQQLVWNPGSVMQARSVQVTSTGPALGEIVSEGVLLDEAGVELAGFRQRLRAWLGRPLLEMRIELDPRQPPDGYAWHAYYAARFAWRDEMATLIRGSSALRSITTQNRPETPDYLELRVGRHNTVLFSGGLPFHQRHGGRMLDVLLICEGEEGRVFELGIGLDREQPMQTALGLVSPVAVVPLAQGPPHVGATGWLYHLDAPQVLLTSLRPTVDHDNGLVATMVECTGVGGLAQFRCARNPVRALIQDLRGNALIDAPVKEDAVDLEISANDLLQLRVEFS